MADRPTETTISAWARLLRAHRLALSSVERALKAAGMPTLAWYDVLLELERSRDNALRPFELERAMLLEQYNLSRLLSRMESAGFIERQTCDDDGRGQIVSITNEGRKQRRKMWPVYALAIESAIGTKLAETEISRFNEILLQLICDKEA